MSEKKKELSSQKKKELSSQKKKELSSQKKKELSSQKKKELSDEKKKELSEKKTIEFNKNIKKYEILRSMIYFIGSEILKRYALTKYPKLNNLIMHTWIASASVSLVSAVNQDYSYTIKTDSKGNKIRKKFNIVPSQLSGILKKFTDLVMKPLGYLNKSLNIVANLILLQFIVMLIDKYTGNNASQLGKYLFNIFKDNTTVINLIKNIDIQNIRNLNIRDLYNLIFIYNR